MTAEFTIEGTAFSTLGYDAEHDQVVELALEDAPGLDAARVVFSVVLASDDAPTLVFSPITGIPTTPTGTVTVTMPSTGTHSWRIQCQVSEGYDATGRINREFTKERIVSVRSPNLGLRKLVPGETTQYDVAGWTEEQNRAVDLLDTYGLGGSGVVSDVTGAAPIVSSGGTTPQISIVPASHLTAGSMSIANFDLLNGASDEADTSTLARRTSSAALRAAWFEVSPSGATASAGSVRLPEDASIVGQLSTLVDARMLALEADEVFLGSDTTTTKIATVDSGGVDLIHGASNTVYARFIAAGPCVNSTEIHIGGARPRIWVSGVGDVPLATARDAPMEGRYQKTTADATDTTPTAMFPITGPMPVAGRVIEAYYIPTAALTSNNSNFAQLNLYQIDDEGSLGTLLSSAATLTTGIGATGNWTARVPVQFTFDEDEIPQGFHIGFSIAKSGTGVTVPAGLLIVRYVLVE